MITNGKITFSRTVRPADFEGKTATVELSFTVADGAAEGSVPGILDEIGALAKEKALSLLGLQASSSIIHTPTEIIATGGATLPAATKATRTKKGGATDMIIDPPAATAPPSGGADEIPGLGGATPEPEQPAADSLDDIMGLGATPEPVKEITDADLNAAVQKKNGELQSPPLIRDLIIKFQPDPSKPPLLANVAQAQRAQFLAELTTLAKPS